MLRRFDRVFNAASASIVIRTSRKVTSSRPTRWWRSRPSFSLVRSPGSTTSRKAIERRNIRRYCAPGPPDSGGPKLEGQAGPGTESDRKNQEPPPGADHRGRSSGFTATGTNRDLRSLHQLGGHRGTSAPRRTDRRSKLERLCPELGDRDRPNLNMIIKGIRRRCAGKVIRSKHAPRG